MKILRYILLIISIFSIIAAGYCYRYSVSYYLQNIFYFGNSKKHISKYEQKRQGSILKNYKNDLFGIDISHYQSPKSIQWAHLSISADSIPISFIIMRCSMGNYAADKNYAKFKQKAHENGYVYGAYHFYRPNEDPIIQANNYIKNAELQSGDLRPILDIEKLPNNKSLKTHLNEIKIWLQLIKNHYNTTPIIYSYTAHYRDYLKKEFADYPLWIADYNETQFPHPSAHTLLWQYTEQGDLNGINSLIDINLFEGTKAQFQQYRLP